MQQEEEKEEELSPEQLKKLEKQRIKEEKKRIAQEAEDLRKFNLRKDLLQKEVDYYHSVIDQVTQTTNYAAELVKHPIFEASRKHKWGCFKMRREWKDLHCSLLLEDIKGRFLGTDYVSHVYLECFDQIMGSYQEIMLEMMGDFEFRRDRMLKNHWAFLKYAKLKGMEFRDDVRTVSYGTSDRYERKCQLLARKQRYHRARIHNKRLNELAENSYDLETKAFNLWVQFRTVFGRFRKDWKVAKRLVFFLKLKDSEDRKLMMQQKAFIEKMEGMKPVQDESYKDDYWNQQNRLFAEERTQYANAFALINHTFKENMKTDEKMLTHMSQASLSVIKELEKIKERLEKILTVKELCFKFETEEEKVFPSEFIDLGQPSIDEEFHSAFGVDKLTYRTAMVKSHCDYMENEVQQLTKTNKDLKNQLRYVLSDLRPNRDIDKTMELTLDF